MAQTVAGPGHDPQVGALAGGVGQGAGVGEGHDVVCGAVHEQQRPGGDLGNRSEGLNVAQLADCAAPALLVAQAIGRVGNWWNQELFGKPTSLPWGLEISPENRPLRYISDATFHPTFLYEALWCLAAAGVLLLIERYVRIRPGGLFALYVLLYSLGRVWIETLRIDPSHEIAGVRLNVYVAALAIVLSAAFFIWWQWSWQRGKGVPPKPETMTIPRQRPRGA